MQIHAMEMNQSRTLAYAGNCKRSLRCGRTEKPDDMDFVSEDIHSNDIILTEKD